jgi:DNA polymerase-3 subunit alpha
MPPDRFVHLHNHSDYSLLDGAMKTRAMAERAVACGMPALALTDHGNLFGAVEFYLACRKAGVRPILGMEAYIARDRLDRATEEGKQAHHLVLLATDLTGWRNLIRLASLGYLEGFYYKPRIDHDLLAAHAQGLIGLSACLSGETSRRLLRDDLAGAVKVAARYGEIFGPDRFYLEIQDHGLEPEAKVRQLTPLVARETGLPVVATNDCHFLQRDHHQAHDILLCIQTNRRVEEQNRLRYETDQVYFKDAGEMLDLFRDWPHATENTLAIADRCNLELKLGELLLPKFPIPDRFPDADAYLEHLAREGLHDRYPQPTAEAQERLAYELNVIRRTGYAGYFLIVWDFILAARRMDIPVGPGRGSAAGSLVCYSLRITDIDPLHNRLLFERFLNPERVSMPDIDIDFCFEKRPRIIQYVIDKYGKDNVSQIITFGTMAARGVLKDVARTLGFSFSEADRISKLVPEGPGVQLAQAIAEVPGFSDVRGESPRHDMLIKNALILEGLSRNPGIHAAGVLITPSALIEHIPLYKSSKDDITSQFDMKMIEELGLLKMDFLGLRTLTVIDKALRLVEETKGIRLTAEEIPLDDPATYRLLQEGRTVGIFQLESSGMQELVRKMQPNTFEDITAVNALFRPGPLGAGMDQTYVDCKHGRKPIRYPHPDLAPILVETYGVILYQEQVMQIASLMGGFSLGEADMLRKAMGKKKKDVMDKMRVLFLEGAQAKGYPGQTAVDVYELMANFAEYGFNKSHSASYAVLTLRTAWLKTHHPAEFMAANMTSEMRKADRVTELVDEVKALGLRIAPPDANSPRPEFSVRGETIVFGMGAVKNVGQKAVEEIAAARERLGRDFRDLFDLCSTVELQKVNSKVLESLIHAGALDALPGHRRQLAVNLERAVAHGHRLARDRQQGQSSLFGGPGQGAAAPALQSVEPYDPLDELSLERRALGFYLSGHPFHEYRELITALPVAQARAVAGLGEGAWVDLAGVVTSYEEARDRNKRLYARTHFEDRTGCIGLIVYASLYETAAALVQGDAILVAGGRVRFRSDGSREVVAERLASVDQAFGDWTQEVLVRLDLDAGGAAAVAALARCLDTHGGGVPPPGGEAVRTAPLLTLIQRDRREWLLQGARGRVELTLPALRALRALPGHCETVLRCVLPPPVPRRGGDNGGPRRRPQP